VPVVIVSGRISDRSYPRYRRLAPLLSGTIGRLHAIGARTEEDRDRFVALGAPADRVAVTGDLKLDPPHALPTPSADLAAWLGDAPRIVAGSTRPGEEAELLAAQEHWERAGHTATLLLAPRHPDRAKEVAGLVRHRRVSLRSAAEAPLAAGDVGVLDTLGELAGAYAGARIAFVGGTLVPVGGHNVLEPAIVGTPVVYGPHVSNARHIADMLERAGAGRRVEDAAGLSAALLEALADAEGCRARGRAGRGVLDAHRGSSERSADWIERALEATPRLRSGERT
jgi:3-deoxy-D-manno-octulosonic-acid transferase